jgi:hypothetical protein
LTSTLTLLDAWTSTIAKTTLKLKH